MNPPPESTHSEELRLRSNYDIQPDGDVWVHYNGILKIIPSGFDADTFLASVDKQAPGEVNVTISKLFKGTVPA